MRNLHLGKSHLVAILFLSCLPTAARAQTTTYTYTGASYTSYSYYDAFGSGATLGPFTPTPCPITISITLAAPLGPNFSGEVYPTNYLFSDCVDTINSSNDQNLTVVLSTDANGKISSWHIQAVGYVVTSFTYQAPPPDGQGGMISFFGEMYTDSGCVGGCDTVGYNDDFGTTLSAASSSIGTWAGQSPLCKVTVPNPETQFDSRWGGMIYDRSDLGLKPYFRIKQKGCALTDISMALENDNISNDPGYLNTLFNNSGGYQPQIKPSGQRTANLIWAKDVLLAEATPSLSLAWKPLGDVAGPSATATSMLNTQLCGRQPAPETQVPTPVIVGVNNGGHYVLVNGQTSNGDYTILDPGHGKTLLSQYGAFTLKGVIQDPSDLSFMSISAGNNVELLLTDPSGDRTGLDLSTTSKYQAIPNSVYSNERLDTINDDGSTTVDPYVFHELTVMRPVSGTYSLTIQGIDTGVFSLLIDSASSSGAVQPAVTLFGSVVPGSSQSYQIPLGANGASASTVPTSGKDCNGIYNGTFKGNITISSGQACAFVGGQITGNVHVTGGSLVLSNASVNGNVQINGGGTFAIGPSTTINGDLEIQTIPVSSGLNVVCGANIKGNLQFQNSGTAAMIGSFPSCPGNTIGGNLEVQSNSASTQVYNNIVSGNLQNQYNTAATIIDGNTVGGNLLDQNNTFSTQVFNNSVMNNLQCQNDTTITGGGNTARKKQGQCSTF